MVYLQPFIYRFYVHYTSRRSAARSPRGAGHHVTKARAATSCTTSVRLAMRKCTTVRVRSTMRGVSCTCSSTSPPAPCRSNSTSGAHLENGQGYSAEGSRASPPLRPREDGLAHPADSSRTNLADTLNLRGGGGGFLGQRVGRGKGVVAGACRGGEYTPLVHVQARRDAVVTAAVADHQLARSGGRRQTCAASSRPHTRVCHHHATSVEIMFGLAPLSSVPAAWAEYRAAPPGVGSQLTRGGFLAPSVRSRRQTSIAA
jgi:hypothetical protein